MQFQLNHSTQSANGWKVSVFATMLEVYKHIVLNILFTMDFFIRFSNFTFLLFWQLALKAIRDNAWL